MDQSGMPKLNPAREPLPSMRDPGQSSGPAPRLHRAIGLAAGLTGLWLLLLFLFHLIPSIDLDVQRLFFRALPCPQHSPGGASAVCGAFPLAEAKTLQLIRIVLLHLPTLIGIGLLLVLIVCLTGRLKTTAVFRQRAALLIATLCLGPGLIVNTLLKDHSGRPRPADIDLFGGALAFRPAGSFDGACHANCSFLSGEAAGIAWLVLAVLILPRPLRRIVLPMTLLIACGGLALRVAFGRHFLSDVALGALSTPLVGTWLMVVGLLVAPPIRQAVTALSAAEDASPKSHQ